DERAGRSAGVGAGGTLSARDRSDVRARGEDRDGRRQLHRHCRLALRADPAAAEGRMRKTPRLMAAAAGVLVLLCVPLTAAAQSSAAEHIGPLASLTPGAIEGLVRDEAGAPVWGAVV